MAIKSVGIIFSPQREASYVAALKLCDWLEARDVNTYINSNGAATRDAKTYLEGSELAEEYGKQVDLAVAFGGDGTLLGAARTFAPHRVPILGVHMGTLGFLTEVDADELYPALEEVLAGRYQIEDRLMLVGQVFRASKLVFERHAFNDIVISKVSLARLIELETYIDRRYLTNYMADGLIIATPTGSTAYVLAAGGPILTPQVEGIVVAPICPFSLTTRPLVVSANQEIRIKLMTAPSAAEEVMITVDGQLGFSLEGDDEIVLRRSPYTARLVRLDRQDFFNTLREKLHWGSKNVVPKGS